MNPIWDIAYDRALEVVSKSIYCHEFEENISVLRKTHAEIEEANKMMDELIAHLDAQIAKQLQRQRSLID
ncbi:hypothetical protein DSM106972_072840 [Dulcicalothrix desertica PCC 7102]|uniref:Uncharacterized protein n=1 Tax=Dulcicalothrix desertica PCC 7102 TaxID=232991 RepID=A0A3S1AHY5_9CYAN|nr:hypothetical protein [Dulcicalothrix desertica]RUT00875.1 hypothetical protein DSM106972_072840 [Dulcicalothrix desertica PCC 7102]